MGLVGCESSKLTNLELSFDCATSFIDLGRPRSCRKLLVGCESDILVLCVPSSESRPGDLS